MCIYHSYCCFYIKKYCSFFMYLYIYFLIYIKSFILYGYTIKRLNPPSCTFYLYFLLYFNKRSPDSCQVILNIFCCNTLQCANNRNTCWEHCKHVRWKWNNADAFTVRMNSVIVWLSQAWPTVTKGDSHWRAAGRHVMHIWTALLSRVRTHLVTHEWPEQDSQIRV